MTRECSIARALDLVGEKWSLLAIREVFLGSFKFNEIQENTGSPRDVLSDRLRKLVASGVMERVPYQEHPQRFHYRLTAMGKDLFAAITVIREWGERYCGEPPRVFHHKCGAVVSTRLVCRSCNEEVTERNVRPVEKVTLASNEPPEQRNRRASLRLDDRTACGDGANREQDASRARSKRFS